jgi:hypothetical protein
MDDPQKKAKDLIQFRDKALAKQQTTRSLWQSVSNMMFPQTYGITTQRSDGQELMLNLFDSTAVEELENMASSIASNLFPAGQKFYRFKTPLGLKDDKEAADYLYYLTEASHEEIFNSNYLSQTGNTIQYWAGFGTGANYCDWTVKDGLNFRDYAIGTYQCMENSKGIIDTIVLTMPMTARQIEQEFGGEGKELGASVKQALAPNGDAYSEFNVIWTVRPRKGRDDTKIDSMNMAWESLYVNEKDAIVLQEGGYEEFPFAIPRYTVLYREVYGRGRGTMLLPQVRVLNRLAKDYQEMSNKWVNPPKEVLDTFEGQVDVSPGALNFVTDMGSIRSIDMISNGAYPVTKDILEYHREAIKQGFYKNAFEPISSLTGDRRNTTEIVERLREGLKKATRPFGRLFVELLQPQITRAALLLIRNGVVETPPESLSGKLMQLRFINPLALALEDQQAKGGQYWVQALGEASQIFPGVIDHVDQDQWARNLGESFGVKADEIRDMDTVEKIRQQRMEQAAQQEQMQAAQLAADAYNKTTKAPEEGSVAGRLAG